MSNFMRWFLFIAITVFAMIIIWIYRTNTIEESSFIEVIQRGRIKVSVTSEPEGIKAKILVDGEDTGRVTPALLKLPPDSYLIRLEAEGYKPAEEEIIVKTLRTEKVNFILEPI